MRYGPSYEDLRAADALIEEVSEKVNREHPIIVDMTGDAALLVGMMAVILVLMFLAVVVL